MLKRLRNIPLWLLVLTIGLTFVMVGLIQGDYLDTLRKAALVCFECIGIG